MIVYFSCGVNRVFYRSCGFTSGLQITLHLWEPSLNTKHCVILDEIEGEGIYYTDFDFTVDGKWIGIALENGLKTTSSVFIVGANTPGIVTYKSK